MRSSTSNLSSWECVHELTAGEEQEPHTRTRVGEKAPHALERKINVGFEREREQGG